MGLTKLQQGFIDRVKGSQSPGYHYCYSGEDLGFDWRHCDTCRSKFGGDRFRMCEYNPETKDRKDLCVCLDCVLYLTYGDLPESIQQGN